MPTFESTNNGERFQWRGFAWTYLTLTILTVSDVALYSHIHTWPKVLPSDALMGLIKVLMGSTHNVMVMDKGDGSRWYVLDLWF